MKRSKIWIPSSELFRQYVIESKNWSDLLRKCGYLHPHNRVTVKKRIEKEQLDTSHFSPTSRSEKVVTYTLEEILVNNSLYKSIKTLKKRLLDKGIFEYRCVMCNLTEWLGNPINLELDHINGNSKDNRIENLRLLCCNCHSFTDTYKGRNVKRETIVDTLCEDCGVKIHKTSKKCVKCSSKSRSNIDLSEDELYEMIHIKNMPYTHIAKELGISDSAVRRRAKVLGIFQPRKRTNVSN